MRNIAVACRTLKDEIELVINELQIEFPVIWIDSGLHTYPMKLKNAIQNQIDKISNVDNILLLFGSCGNSLQGLVSNNARLIFPLVDDCISLFLGGNEKRRAMDRKSHSYYLTKGYFENEVNIWTEYCYSLKKYGQEKTKKIFARMLTSYETLRIIETGAYNPNDILEPTLKMAKEFGLKHELVPGSLRIVYKAFNGEWDEEFKIVEPGQKICLYDLGLSSSIQ